MKIVLLCVVAVVAGLAVGLGSTAYEMNSGVDPDEQLRAIEAAFMPSGEQPAADEDAPKVVVPELVYNFGVMDERASLSHSFVFINEGKGPLYLKQGETSCACTVSEVSDAPIPPGGRAMVTLNWKAKKGEEQYRQTADIRTNDPAKPMIELMVEGKVDKIIKFVPEEVVLSSVSASEAGQGEARLFSMRDSAFEITGETWLDPTVAEFFAASYAPLPADVLTSEGAKSGYLVTITAKPGLPLGPIQQKVTVRTNLPHSPSVPLTIRGKVVGDITIVGRDFSNELHQLRLGVVPGETGVSRVLNLLIRGEHRETIKFEVADVNPSVLKVEIGELKQLSSGTVAQLPVTISVPPGTAPMDHLGTPQAPAGEVVLTTTHPDIPRLRIGVAFAVDK